jgi:ribosome-associated protein
MEDMLQETDSSRNLPADNLPPASLFPQALGDMLKDHKGADVLVLDLRDMNTWTDFFVIATSTSETHMDGLERHIKELCREMGVDILRRSFRPEGEDEWRIIDLGSTVIHLMSRKSRDFYNLERLYPVAAINAL